MMWPACKEYVRNTHINLRKIVFECCCSQYETVLSSIRHFTHFCAHNSILNSSNLLMLATAPEFKTVVVVLSSSSSSETLKMCKSLKTANKKYIRKPQKKARIGLPSSKRNNNIKMHLRHDMYQSPYYRDHSWGSMIPVTKIVVSVRQQITTGIAW
jgi:hypothetical protein